MLNQRMDTCLFNDLLKAPNLKWKTKVLQKEQCRLVNTLKTATTTLNIQLVKRSQLSKRWMPNSIQDISISNLCLNIQWNNHASTLLHHMLVVNKKCTDSVILKTKRNGWCQEKTSRITHMKLSKRDMQTRIMLQLTQVNHRCFISSEMKTKKHIFSEISMSRDFQ